MGRHLIETAVEQARSQEPVWLRYKASILIVATGLVAILAQLAESADWQGTQTGAVLTAVVTAASFLLNRLTRDGITPSMAPRIAQAVGETGGA